MALLQLHKGTTVFDMAIHSNRIVKTLDLAVVYASADQGLLHWRAHVDLPAFECSCQSTGREVAQ